MTSERCSNAEQKAEMIPLTSIRYMDTGNSSVPGLNRYVPYRNYLEKSRETIDKPANIPYSYFIASASENGRASRGKSGHKSGPGSLPWSFSSCLAQ